MCVWGGGGGRGGGRGWEAALKLSTDQIIPKIIALPFCSVENKVENGSHEINSTYCFQSHEAWHEVGEADSLFFVMESCT